MNDGLQLTLLGSPRLLMDGQPLATFATNKAQALLFYLAVTGQPHRRDVLATLLWADMTDAQAKKNLRTVLPDLRRLVGNHVRIDRQTIAFDRDSAYWLDVEVLRRSLAPGRAQGAGQAPVALETLQTAIDLYQGEFLSGFYVNNAPDFEAWVQQQREQMHVLVVEALFALVNEHAGRADYAAALAANRRLLALEPWSEPTHRQQMLLLSQMGERTAALAQYETCRHTLAAEFGVDPLPETTALYEQIRAGEIERQRDEVQNLAPKAPSPESRGQSLEAKRLEARNESPDAAVAEREQDDLAAPTLVVGDHLPQQTKLYGRQPELVNVHNWIVEDRCRLVGIFGIGGQGKTSLAASLVRGFAQATPLPNLPKTAEETDASPTNQRLLAQPGVGRGKAFHRIIWQSLLNAPRLNEVMQEWIYVLSDQTVTSLSSRLDQQFSQLIDYLHSQRCLLILDNLESVLQNDGRGGHYRPGYEAYGQLIHHLATSEHHSCLLLTSRERPFDLTHLEEDTPAVRFLSLTGLPAAAGRQMLSARGVAGDAATMANLVQHYSGNPLALKLVGETVQEIFDGNIAAFLQADTLVFDDIRHVLDQQFARLTPLEREIMIWLAIVREPITFNALRDLLAQPPNPRQVLEAMRSLQRRSLLERYDDGFGLQNVVLEYATDLLVENMSRELLDAQVTGWQEEGRQEGGWQEGKRRDEHAGHTLREHSVALSPHLAERTSLSDLSSLSPFGPLSHLNGYALILAHVKEYVRASQTRLLLQPVAQRLLRRLGNRGAEQQLQRLLVHLQTMMSSPGYSAANLLHLLLELGVDLRGYDFSRLYLRQLYLRGVSLPQVNFAQAEFIESVFTEPFGITHTAVISPDGHYLAAGTSEGAIYIWRTADQQLAQVIQAHNQGIKQIAFAQRPTSAGDTQLVLASASDDKSVGFWALGERPQARWHVQLSHEEQQSVLAIGFSPDGQRLTSVDVDGRVFVWNVSTQTGAQLVHHFATPPTRFGLVSYSGDGQTIAIGRRDGVVQLWNLATGEADLVVTVSTTLLAVVALSKDGRMLATGDEEGQLCLWRLPSGRLQQVVETNAGAIDAMAFSSDGKLLASSHWDRAVRLWDVDAQDGLHLHHTLLGHSHMIWSVFFGAQRAARPETNGASAASAPRQLLVSGSSDQTVRVWDAATGQALYTLYGQPRALALLAICPLPPTQSTSLQTPLLTSLSTQRSTTSAEVPWLLAAVSYDQLVHLWQGRGAEVVGARRVLRGTRGLPFTVAISPDARTVASAGSDHVIDLWDVESGQMLHTLAGHSKSVLCLAFHPDGTLLASGSTDGTVRLWSLQAGARGQSSAAKESLPSQPMAVLPANPRFVYDLAFSPDGRVLATVGADCVLRLWNMAEQPPSELVAARKTIQAEGEQDIFAVAFSPDGTKLACGGNHLIHLWELPNKYVEQAQDAQTAEVTGAEPLVLRQHTSWIFSVAFSPDGTTVASSGVDCTVCLWDVTSGALRATLRGHNETIYKVAFTPDGTTLLSCGFDGVIKFWDAESGDCLNTLRVEGPYAEMNINGITGVTEAQTMALKALGAVAEGD